MTDLPAHPVTSLRLVLVYTAALIGGTILLAAIVIALAAFFDIAFENSAMGFILIFAAANYVGQFWYSREAARPASNRAWQVAFLCTVVTVILQGLMIWGSYHLALLESQSSVAALRGEDATILAAVFAGLAVLVLLLIRFSIGMGAKQAAKQKTARAQKG